jgi:GMP synthase-like glutamine amidotransferase
MKFLVLQHIGCEHPGSLRDLWRADGITWDTVELDQGDQIPPLEGYAAMVVMGGPMDVWQEDAHPWLIPEKAAIREWVQADRPYLGLCLGHQLLAEATGGAVGPGTSEVGLGSVALTPEGTQDRLLSTFGDSMNVFQWHSAEVTRMPVNAVRLAGNEATHVQALRTGRNAYGLQYHVELTADTVPEWKAIPEYAQSLAEIFGPNGADALEAEVAGKLPEFFETAAILHRAFHEIVRAHHQSA